MYQNVPMMESPSALEENANRPDASWPLLLKGILYLNSKPGQYKQEPEGCEPLKRPIDSYIENGFINLDKPRNPTSHEVVAWIKKRLYVKKCGHSGTLDPSVTGSLIVCISRATLLLKSQQAATKSYVAVMGLSMPFSDFDELNSIFQLFKGALFQKPPILAAVKRALRTRVVKRLKMLEYDREQGLALFKVSCMAGTYVRTLCNHIGLAAGCRGVMEDLRRVKSGNLTEYDNMATMHDICDAKWIYDEALDESYLRKIIMPMERLLTKYRRIVIKDSAVNAICYGSRLAAGGILYYDERICHREEIVLITTKGEIVALARATVSGYELGTNDQVMVAKLSRVIMKRDIYRRQWYATPAYKERKRLEANGSLPKRADRNRRKSNERRKRLNWEQWD